MNMQWLAFLIVAALVLSGSIVLGVLADREKPAPPTTAPAPEPDLDAHWSQTKDLFKPEEGQQW